MLSKDSFFGSYFARPLRCWCVIIMSQTLIPFYASKFFSTSLRRFPSLTVVVGIPEPQDNQYNVRRCHFFPVYTTDFVANRIHAHTSVCFVQCAHHVPLCSRLHDETWEITKNLEETSGLDTGDLVGQRVRVATFAAFCLLSVHSTMPTTHVQCFVSRISRISRRCASDVTPVRLPVASCAERSLVFKFHWPATTDGKQTHFFVVFTNIRTFFRLFTAPYVCTGHSDDSFVLRLHLPEFHSKYTHIQHCIFFDS